MKAKLRYLSLQDRTRYRTLEDVLGCKWSTAVLAAIAEGIRRPGALERAVPGISTKVLNERLRRLVAFELLTRLEFPGLPARVDYELTPTGRKLAKIIAQLKSLNDAHRGPS
jgi:DNA-binding HxlR family transcriptional regulator